MNLITTQQARCNRLAQLVADGATVAEAGALMRLTKGQTSNAWNSIKRGLGSQAA